MLKLIYKALDLAWYMSAKNMAAQILALSATVF